MTDNGTVAATDTVADADHDLVIRIDGRQPLSAETVAAVAVVCGQAEDRGGPGVVRVEVSGSPEGPRPHDLKVGLVNKWERTLRRLERSGMTTVAIATGDCGGTALDALLATDYRIARPDVRLVVPVEDGATWPGMALYRLSQQTGVARIRRAVLFGRPIEAAEALDLHLVDELADDPAGALAASPELAGVLSSPELAIRRQLMLDATTTSFEEALGSHLAACDRVLRKATAGAAS
ncbi:enoyl-CoA-hydratase DpgB [Kitasatospora sp. NPDC092286]|uniref:enoyl-CoA-hydratase DpgB n=1 Tax=Kitasatospora sp. NPDC092286 TaxID=3364087 RepID=UPI0037F19AE9